MILNKINNETLWDYLKSLSGKRIVLYGAGGFGKELAEIFINNGIIPLAFLDKNKNGEISKIPVFHPENYKYRDIVLVLSIVLNKKTRNEILSYLKGLGYENIIDGQSIRARYVEFEEGYKLNTQDVQKPLSYLADEESRQTYIKNINAHFSRNYCDCEETDEEFQYFTNLPHNNRFLNFVDCGAYIADTLLEAKRACIDIKNYYAFEPIKENYDKLLQNAKNVNLVAKNAAVCDKNGIIKFDSKMGSSSSNKEGQIEVPCVTLDYSLGNIKIDFLKMDIEGEEINALYGAQNLIKEQKPNMAICVYHYINHFWDIANLIHSWNLGYKLYLRAHSSACMETVLYAIKEEKCQ